MSESTVTRKKERKRKGAKTKKSYLQDRDLDLGVLDASIVVDVDGGEDAAGDEGEEGLEDTLFFSFEIFLLSVEVEVREEKKEKKTASWPPTDGVFRIGCIETSTKALSNAHSRIVIVIACSFYVIACLLGSVFLHISPHTREKKKAKPFAACRRRRSKTRAREVGFQFFFLISNAKRFSSSNSLAFTHSAPW